MRIVMIGHSSAGKTTYMASMYRVMNAGHRGFRIRAGSEEHHQRLLQDALAIRKGRFPPPSSHREVYPLVLSYDHRPFFDFTWHDYRGGALKESATEKDNAQVIADLVQADAIIVFADAHALATLPAAQRDVRRLTVVTHQAISERATRVPLVIAYTKADLVGRREWAAVQAPLQALEVAARNSAVVDGTSVRVCCGRRPRSVHVPVLWSLAFGLSARIARLEEEVGHSRRSARSAGSKASLRDSFDSWLNGTKSYRRISADYDRTAEQTLAEIEPLREPGRRLEAVLRRAHRV